MHWIHFGLFSTFFMDAILVVATCGCNISPYCARDCGDILDMGFYISDVYRIYPGDIRTGIDVYCDMDTENGGWLVFQRRKDGSTDFNKAWHRYQLGFGDLSGEHWLGNYQLSMITSQNFYELRVDMEDWEGNKTFAKYQLFNNGKRDRKYPVAIEGHSGDAQNSMYIHNDMQFSTYDKDHSKLNCTDTYTGGWWFNDENCVTANLNGLYVQNGTANRGIGIVWRNWRGLNYSLKRTEMKIRRFDIIEMMYTLAWSSGKW